MQFSDREKAFEDKFALDEELMFKVRSRRNKQSGLWAAKLMGYDSAKAEAYASSIVESMLSKEQLLEKITGDLGRANVQINADEIFKTLDDFAVAARKHFMEQEA